MLRKSQLMTFKMLDTMLILKQTEIRKAKGIYSNMSKKANRDLFWDGMSNEVVGCEKEGMRLNSGLLDIV